MRRALRDNGLATVFGLLFLGALAAQAIVGHIAYNDDEIRHAQLLHETPETISLGRYVVSSSFGRAVMENWQSEYLQFSLFVFLTIWLVQRGSPESKEPGSEGRESEKDQLLGDHAKQNSPAPAKRTAGFVRWLYSNSLGLVVLALWLGTWLAQSLTGWSAGNAERLEHSDHAISWLQYLGTADFWEETLQNWQSEFLAVGSFVILTVYLRQRGSPESKPVGMPHDTTGASG